MFLYEIRTGKFYKVSPMKLEILAQGYSGFGDAKNDSIQVDKPALGPIPPGSYQIGTAQDTETHGPVVMQLIPSDGFDIFNRCGFLIHGDSIQNPGFASHGCIILPRPVREVIDSAPPAERFLLVVPSLST